MEELHQFDGGDGAPARNVTVSSSGDVDEKGGGGARRGSCNMEVDGVLREAALLTRK